MSIIGTNLNAPVAKLREGEKRDVREKRRALAPESAAREPSPDELDLALSQVEAPERPREVKDNASEETHDDRVRHGAYGADGSVKPAPEARPRINLEG